MQRDADLEVKSDSTDASFSHILAKITCKRLNQCDENGRSLLWLCASLNEGRAYLVENPTLCGLIDVNVLMKVPKGETWSAYQLLCKFEHSQTENKANPSAATVDYIRFPMRTAALILKKNPLLKDKIDKWCRLHPKSSKSQTSDRHVEVAEFGSFNAKLL